MFFPINTRKLIAQKIRGIWNPELYHGWGKEKRFFEGWYYKIVSKDEKSAFAFIPGIAMDENGNKQAFIQILDGKCSTSEYVKFPFNSFKASPKRYEIEIDKNLWRGLCSWYCSSREASPPIEKRYKLQKPIQSF